MFTRFKKSASQQSTVMRLGPGSAFAWPAQRSGENHRGTIVAARRNETSSVEHGRPILTLLAVCEEIPHGGGDEYVVLDVAVPNAGHRGDVIYEQWLSGLQQAVNHYKEVD